MYFKKYLFLVIYLGMSALSCGTWDLVPRPRIEPRPPALGEQSLRHWTTRKVPLNRVLMQYLKNNEPQYIRTETKIDLRLVQVLHSTSFHLNPESRARNLEFQN